MKTLTKLALAAVILISAFAAQAGTVRGHFRGNGTYVAPYYRTPANGTPYDNLSYRGYPSQQPGYVSPRSYSGWSRPTPLPSYRNSVPRTLPYTGGYATYTCSSTTCPSYRSSCFSYPSSYSVYGSSTQLGGTTFHNYSSSDGGYVSGTTTTIGNTSYTSLYGW